MNLSETLWNFLKSDATTMHIEKSMDTYDKNFYIAKMPYNKSIELLFLTNTYRDKIDNHDKLEYCGFYNKTTEQLYDISYVLKRELLNLDWNEEPYPDLGVLKQQFSSMVNSLVTNYVLDNKDEFYDVVKDYESNITKHEVYQHIIDEDKDIKYRCSYHTESLDEILSYMDQDLPYLQKIVFDTIERNKESIGKELKNIDRINEFITEINNDKSDSIHKRKDIVDSLKNENYGMVHLYINKKGKDFDFKYNASTIKNHWDYSYLPTYYIPAKNRKEFEDAFDYREELLYEDIYKIEYRGKAIYEDKEFVKTSPEETQEIAIN